ncbi:hypothetical protein [Oceanospirillum sediminis]|uniref:Uncharacterized protein n=1 Tax=Oceanospirillum sediminis TaxID=2760088 RepID=A0A839IXB3_9GAMM|nr:hypothetical protein [Oceanospirillum sediminis]MBB1489089.1 hypothetical protein [Oceanospirillum sediminis]
MKTLTIGALLTLSIISLSAKYLRYTHPVPDEKIVTAKIESRLNNMGWHLEYTLAMNTNMTSKLMILKKEHCSGYLYLNISGSDASNVSIFKNYLGLSKIDFILSDQSLDDYVYMSFYMTNVYNKFKSLFFSESAYYSPLLLTHNSSDQKNCSLISNLNYYNETLDLSASDII